MAESKKSAESKNMADVARPGKSTPSASSRPVIVTNRPIMKDPMVVDDTATATDGDQATKSPSKKTNNKGSSGEARIQPPAASTANAIELQNSEDSPDSAGSANAKSPANQPNQPEQPNMPSESEKPDNPEKSENSDDKATTEAPNGPDTEAKARQEAQRQAGIKKLVNSKQFFLPINAVEQRRSKRFIALGMFLSLLLTLAWFNIALDAGLIQIDGLKPITSFFSN